MNPEGYVGNSVGLELGFALGKNKPVYSLASLDLQTMEVDDLGIRRHLECMVTVLPPENVASHYRETWQNF